MATVLILGMDLHTKDKYLSLLQTFQSQDQSPNPNQWKNPIVQESISESESYSESGNENKTGLTVRLRETQEFHMQEAPRSSQHAVTSRKGIVNRGQGT